jgi:hypothetical protein
MPLREVLQKIATQAGLEIVVQGAVEQPVSADLRRTPLEEGLQRITQDFNRVFRYRTQKTGPDLLEKVQLYAKEPGKGNSSPVIFSPGSSRPQ